MLAPYRSILSTPGSVAFSAAGLVARLEIAMVGLGTVLLVERSTDSYAIAGAVAAAGGISNALTAPFLARLVDRFGQATILRPASVVHGLGLVALVVLSLVGAPVALLFAAGIVAGVSQVSVGSLVRARWARPFTGTPQLQTAFALESVLDEFVFIVGPMVITTVATLLHPAVGLVLAAVTAVTGSWLLAAQRRTEPPARALARAAEAVRAAPVLRSRGIVVLILVFMACGGVFGSGEVAVAAFAEEQGAPAAAGVVLALWATASMTAGLAYGAVRWKGRLERRFIAAVLLFGAGTAPMAFATNLPLLAVAFFVAGFAISPVIVAGTALVERIMPPHRLTEGLAWTGTGLNLTYALSTALVGIVIDQSGARAGLMVPVCCGVVAAVVALVGVSRLAAHPHPAPEPA